ncbi:MAG: zinc-dependent metalloprotease [Pseudomonadota bacterium]
MPKPWFLSFLSLGLAVMAASTPLAVAQDEGDEENGLPSIAEAMDGMEADEGFFPVYKDPETGELYLEIAEDQLGEEFIAFNYIENSVLEAGGFRGEYGTQSILRFDRHYGDIEVTEVNTSFVFDEDNPISRAADANISNAILTSLEIIAITEGDDGDRLIVSADDLLLDETLAIVRSLPSPYSGPFAFEVGDLTPATKFAEVRNYPDNIDFVVDYVFFNPYPFGGGSEAVTDERSVTIKVQHSFIAMPDDGYTPRLDDYRVGYFFDRKTSLTSDEAAPYRDLIHRWRLVKKDPGAELSDPVKPITWWIENTTPHELRPAIREGVLAWNEAFETAGFSNAIEVKVQPDDAAWDAGDIRYNVLRWSSSPIPPFGGYGPSFTNPRTGEILGADIMLELSYLFAYDRIVTTFDGSTQPFAIVDEEQKPRGHHEHHCHAGSEMRQGILFAAAALQAAEAREGDWDELVRQSLVSLIMHEVGHTLGLHHNMKASSLYGPDEIHDPSITQGAPTASVMDYLAPNLAPIGVEQGDFDHTRPGSYDLWAIRFGYDPDLDDPAVRAEHLAKSSEPGHVFGNDADTMWSSWWGIDPRTNAFDMSSDPVSYAIDRIELVQSVIPELLPTYEGEDSYQALRDRFYTALLQQSRMGVVMSRQIGGVHVERVDPGQETDTVPFKPVPRAKQREAMDALATYIFAPDAFDIPADLLQHIQSQRRGFDHFRGTEDPKIHAYVLGAQRGVLAYLMSRTVLTRMVDSELYGNSYSPTEMLLELNEAVFGRDLVGVPNDFRKNLQVEYVQRLVVMAYGYGYPPAIQSAAFAAVEDIRSRFTIIPDFFFPAETRAHRATIRMELSWLN